ncbi:pyrimidine utilization protein D [Paraglaciecola sp. L3A3]|uniref:pyrimidine utilization protein D n=1 Tax=Paraglaciecola sp. L3A3 TaxID=2686358 RepID=UPI00131AB39A|nr:pyrimidine utilization protein D [Paraglaciecola sp. L3A3]
MHFEVLGSQKADAPTLVLSSGLGGSAHFWQPQLPALESDYRVIVYDQNGTGRSPATLPEDYSIESMADELLDLLDYLQITACHFVGHALGGLVGLQIALQRPRLLQRLVLINAWSSPNPHTLRCFRVRKSLLDNSPPEMYLQAQALFLYPPDWIMDNVERLEQEERHMLQAFPDKHNLLARIQALSQFDIEADLAKITTATLIIANKDDMLVPWQRSEVLARYLVNSELAVFDYGAHACTVTTPSVINDRLLTYLAS